MEPFVSLVAQGAGPTPQEAWRQTWFGTTANSGDAADLFDYDKDGLVNLVEFALGLNPRLGSSNQLPLGQITGGNFVTSFQQPVGVSGISYGAEWGTTLNGSWIPITDTGIPPQHIFSVPIGGRTSLFVRLRVTPP